jgi:hypothetical protein
VPDDDETVATGACVQAAWIHSGTEAATAWPLGAGEDL